MLNLFEFFYKDGYICLKINNFIFATIYTTLLVCIIASFYYKYIKIISDIDFRNKLNKIKTDIEKKQIEQNEKIKKKNNNSKKEKK